jgi:hypothetical protein
VRLAAQIFSVHLTLCLTSFLYCRTIAAMLSCHAHIVPCPHSPITRRFKPQGATFLIKSLSPATGQSTCFFYLSSRLTCLYPYLPALLASAPRTGEAGIQFPKPRFLHPKPETCVCSWER